MWQKIWDFIKELFNCDDDAPIYTPIIHRSSFLFDNAKTRVMNILSIDKSDDGFKSIINRCKANGDTVIYLYMSNAGDGSPSTTSFYVGNQHAGAIDSAKLSLMRSRMRYCIDNKLGVIAWLFADDSSSITKQDMIKHLKYTDDVVTQFDDLIYGYCVGIECNEYFDTDKVKQIIARLRGKISVHKEIGVHWTPGKKDLCGADLLYYQYGFGKSEPEIESTTKVLSSQLGAKVIAAEYSTNSDKEGKKLGQAALRGGAVGTGNGA